MCGVTFDGLSIRIELLSSLQPLRLILWETDRHSVQRSRRVCAHIPLAHINANLNLEFIGWSSEMGFNFERGWCYQHSQWLSLIFIYYYVCRMAFFLLHQQLIRFNVWSHSSAFAAWCRRTHTHECEKIRQILSSCVTIIDRVANIRSTTITTIATQWIGGGRIVLILLSIVYSKPVIDK